MRRQPETPRQAAGTLRRAASKSEAAKRDKRELFSIDEVMERTGLSRPMVYRLFKSGELGSVHVGRRRCVSRGQLDNFIARLEADAS